MNTNPGIQQAIDNEHVRLLSIFYVLSMPFGTILGVFTFIVLARPSVSAQFGRTTTEVVRQ